MADRAVDRAAGVEAGIGMPQPGDRLDIQQRQCAARRLLDAAIGVAVERPQEAGHIPIGPRADRQKRLGGAGQKFVGAAIVECDALPGFELPDKAAQLIRLRRPHADREVARDLEIAGASELNMQCDIADRRCR